MLNAGAGILGIAVQVSIFGLLYLVSATSRGRSRALLFAAVMALSGYALVLLGLATVGVPWQVSNVLLGVSLAMLYAVRAGRVGAFRAHDSLFRWLRLAFPSATIIGLLLGIQVLAVVLLPELSIDGQLYHGPVLAQLVDTGTVWGWQSPNQYMYYTDLTMLGGVNLATFTGAAVFDNGVQLPHLLVLILALNVLLARRFDRAWVRIAFAALLVSAPVIWLQPRILYVDVAYGAAVATLIVLIVTSRRIAGLEMAVAGVSAAAILATKPTGILTSALLMATWIVVGSWRRRRDGLPLARAIWPVVLVAAIPMSLGLGFYLRNLVSFGNPVYPVAAWLGPIHLRGIVDLSVFASGDRGAGLFDPGRLVSYAGSLGTGMLNGVTKPDYDPRAGGYGYITLAVLALAIGVLIAQALFVVLARRRIIIRAPWRTQVAVVVLVAAVLVIQPSTFDSRYVIGPTTVLLAAILMSSIFVAPRVIDVVAGACALAIAAGQIVWTETQAYPGLHIAKALRGLTERAQPMTPGNPWGKSESIAWLPANSCSTVALQTDGGVAAWGMTEQSQLGTLPYGLYGESLCNLVTPMQLSTLQTRAAATDPVPTADFLALYTADVPAWQALYPKLAPCWAEVTAIPPTDAFPQAVTVFASSCR